MSNIIKWEYRVINIDSEGRMHDLQIYLDTIGADGWELCAIQPRPKQDDMVFFYFKRPIITQGIDIS